MENSANPYCNRENVWKSLWKMWKNSFKSLRILHKKYYYVKSLKSLSDRADQLFDYGISVSGVLKLKIGVATACEHIVTYLEA